MTALDAFFQPKSVAVIGASSRRGSLGREILHNIIEYEFNGKLFPVNPRAEFIHSIKSYPTVLDIPDEVELAVVVVPAGAVPHVVRECGEKGVKGIVVISAGFKETGAEGAERERELQEWSVSSMNPLFDDSSRPSTAASVRMRPMVEPVGPGVNSAGLTDEEQAAKREALRLELAKKMKEELNAKRMGTVQALGEPAEQQV